ncbi:MAG: hypothetical protein AB1445_00940 [Bacillota bacterium]
MLGVRLGYALWVTCLVLLLASTRRADYLQMTSYVILMAITGHCIGIWRRRQGLD